MMMEMATNVQARSLTGLRDIYQETLQQAQRPEAPGIQVLFRQYAQPAEEMEAPVKPSRRADHVLPVGRLEDDALQRARDRIFERILHVHVELEVVAAGCAFAGRATERLHSVHHVRHEP